jgi:Type I phosphodiesterase / nucleotide pyrophosphatase
MRFLIMGSQSVVRTGLAVLGIGSAAIAAHTWLAFNGYRPPEPAHIMDAPPSRALTSRVVVILIDGLRLDTSRSMPFLNELRRRGADFDCTVGSPSLSMPGRATLLSGAWADVHGQLLNAPVRALAVDHLFAAARRQGLRTGLAATANEHELVAPFVDVAVRYPRRPATQPDTLESSLGEAAQDRESARPLLADRDLRLVQVELYSLDDMGHRDGGASADYLRAALGIDQEIRRLAESLDERGVTLVVTSDHGHTDRGGHGGDEPVVLHVPLVLAGAGIKGASTGHAEQIDLAPTLATLLGIPIPAASEGRPLVEVLALEPAAAAAVTGTADRRRADLARALAGQSAPHSPWRRGAGALVLGLSPILLVLAAATPLPRGAVGAAILYGVGGALLYAALRPLLGLSTSLSAIHKEDAVLAFFGTNTALAAAVCFLAMVGANAAGAAGERSDRMAIAVAVFVAPLTVRMAWMCWTMGFALAWPLPGMRVLLGLYFDSLALAAIGLTAPLMLWGADRISARP